MLSQTTILNATHKLLLDSRIELDYIENLKIKNNWVLVDYSYSDNEDYKRIKIPLEKVSQYVAVKNFLFFNKYYIDRNGSRRDLVTNKLAIKSIGLQPKEGFTKIAVNVAENYTDYICQLHRLRYLNPLETETILTDFSLYEILTKTLKSAEDKFTILDALQCLDLERLQNTWIFYTHQKKYLPQAQINSYEQKIRLTTAMLIKSVNFSEAHTKILGEILIDLLPVCTPRGLKKVDLKGYVNEYLAEIIEDGRYVL